MSGRVSLQKRVQQLKKMEADLPKILREAAREAAKRAVEAAAEATPPRMGIAKGTNTQTGELKAHWAADSKTEPDGGGLHYTTVLANNMEYASYVNDGHRMDRHFVPGLYVNPYSGMLERDPSRKVGLVVGTRTRYVKGKFMKEKGIAAYQKAVLAILDSKIKEAAK